MSTLLLVIGFVLLLGLGGSVVVFLMLRASRAATKQRPQGAPEAAPHEAPKQPIPPPDGPRFRWRMTALPIIVLVLSVALVAYFGRLLADDVARHFTSDGTPDKWTSRGTILLWTLLPQALLTLLALGITWGGSRLDSVFQHARSTGLPAERILAVMGNMVALPQAILLFAVADMFSYNSYQTHLFPVWVFALVVMTVGAVILGAFFANFIRQTSGQ